MIQWPYCPVVYRMYGTGDRLLYVGSSIRHTNRISNHRASSWWWELVERIAIERHPSKAAAIAAEAAAIRSEAPAFNALSTGSHRYALTRDDVCAYRKWAIANSYRMTNSPTWMWPLAVGVDAT